MPLSNVAADTDIRLPLAVLGKNVIPRFRSRVAPLPAFGVVPLWWRAGRRAGFERVGRDVVVKYGIAPSAAVCESPAVFFHEVDVQEAARSCRLREKFVLLRLPVDLGHLGPVRDWLAVGGNTRLISLDHRGIAEDHRHHSVVPTDADGLPSFISSEIREGEPARHFNGVLVLRGNGQVAQDSQPDNRDPNCQHAPTIHRSTPSSKPCIRSTISPSGEMTGADNGSKNPVR